MVRSGEMSQDDLYDAEAAMCRSQGHCAVMGTASTMACMAESLGIALPQNAAIPAADSRRKVLAWQSGRRIVEMVKQDQKPSDILTRKAFENAIMVNAAIGGSTNFVLHLLAIAGRIGVPLQIEDFDHYSTHIPLMSNLQPSGSYFMEDFYYAGGLPALMAEMQEWLHTEIMTVSGKTVKENIQQSVCYNREVIASGNEPFNPLSGIVVLKGNICPDGAVIKPSAATPALMQHSGRAVVFENIEDYKTRIDDPELDIDEHCIMVLKNVGPIGYPGMPEVGNMGLPKKILAKGIRDMVRISDGRMSGTGFGTVVLHVSPEAATGGAFSLLENGDIITLDVGRRSLNVQLTAKALEQRKKKKQAMAIVHNRGYAQLYTQHVLQAHLGADLDFLQGQSGSAVTRDSH
jgi:dihydroxy-acid dehydratase